MNDYHSNVTSYTYTDLHQVDTITAPGSKVWDFAYNAGGQVTRTDLPNGMHTEYAYDARSRLDAITHKDGTTVEQSFDYTLNVLNQITRIDHEDTSYWTYAYDDRGRLTVAVRYDDTATEEYREAYTYDDGDNMLTKAVTPVGQATVTTTYTVNNANELTAQSDGTESLTFTYDDAGRQATKSDGTYTTTNSWRYGDLLETVDTSDPNGVDVTYLYGGDGMRRERSHTGGGYTWYNYAGFSLVSEEAQGTGIGDGALTWTHIPGLADAAGQNPATASYRYYLHDHLGSTRSVYDQNKTQLGTWEPTPFGDPLTDTLPADVLHRYTGHLLDPVTEAYYAPYRYYAPGQGRWLKRDPLGMIDGPNMFGYVGSAPILFVDPLGLLVLGRGLSVTLGAGLGLTVGVSVVVDSNGNFGVAVTRGFGLMGGATASATGDRLYHGGSIGDLDGGGGEFGLSGGSGAVGGFAFVNNNPDFPVPHTVSQQTNHEFGALVSGGVGVGTLVEAHGFKTDTDVFEIGNVWDLLNQGGKLIKQTCSALRSTAKAGL